MSLISIQNIFKRQDGVTLLEALIFMFVLSLIIFAIAFSTTHSLRRTQFNVDKIFATRYGEEVEEWMRGEKEANWTTFSARSPGTYCMNAEITTCDAGDTCWDENAACDSDDYSLGESGSLNNGFKRTVELTTVGTRVDVDIVVSWIDGPNTYDVTLNSSFSRWE